MNYQKTLDDLYLKDLETEYRFYSRNLSPRELVEIFKPEVIEILKQKILELYRNCKVFELSVARKLKDLNDIEKDIFEYLANDQIEEDERCLKSLVMLYNIATNKRGHERQLEGLDSIIEAVPITRVLEYYGLDGRRVGGRIQMRCVFHEDRTPSLMIYPDSNSFYCFGCGKGGNIFNFVMEKENTGFNEALKIIKMLM